MRNTLLIVILLGVLAAGCRKGTYSVGYITAAIDGNVIPFTNATAIYSKTTKFIRISANLTNGDFLQMFAYLPSPGPLGTVFFKANGTNTAIFIEKKRNTPTHIANPETFSCSDDNKADLEGELTITKFDEVNGLVSGTFAFKTYNRKNNLYHIITDGQFIDIQIGPDITFNQFNTSMTCMSSPSNEWATRYVRTYKITPVGSAATYLNIIAATETTWSETPRSLNFTIPISQVTGTFPVKAEGTPNEPTVKYNYYFDSYDYDPVPNAGTITIHSLDEVNKTMSFSFNLEMKNQAGSTITFANGQLDAKWFN